MNFSEAALKGLQVYLEQELITDIDEDDVARADVVKIGKLYDDPEIEDAPIAVEIYSNDPEKPDEWFDKIVEWEMPRTAIWSRKFTILWRTLLTESGEDLDDASAIASTVKKRLEYALNTMDWSTVTVEEESIAYCPLDDMESTMSQGGGPDEYDYNGKIRFSVTTRSAFIN